ncbi:hypothetical protein ACFL6O_05055 [candidate division KSB1 bacterium]
MHKLPKKSKFFNQNNTPEEEDPERTFHYEMSEAYAGASSAAAQSKKTKGKGKFLGVEKGDAKGARKKK